MPKICFLKKGFCEPLQKTTNWAFKNPNKKKKIALNYYYRNKLAGGKTNAGE